MMKYNRNIPLKKADDWTRRTFIKRASLFLGAFGVPWVAQMELSEKISKKLFGSALAFAAGTDPIPAMVLGFRAGYPMESSFCMGNDADAVNTAATRNIHFGPDTTITVPAATTLGQNLYLAPQMAAFAASSLVTKTAMVTSVANMNGHTAEPSSIWKDNSGHFLNHVSKRNAVASPLLNQAIVFGNSNDMTYDRLGSVLTGEYAPMYSRSGAEVRSLFQPFQPTASDGSKFAPTLSQDIFGVMNSDFNQKFIALIKDRPGGSQIVASVNKLKELLSINLGTQLTPDNASMTLMATGVTAPNQMPLSTVFGASAANLVEFFATAGLIMAKGVSYQVALTLNTGDWHGRNTAFAAANVGAGTAQGQHAACWNQLLVNVFNEYTTNPIYRMPNGQQLGDALRMAWFSEFTRTYLVNNGDNGDGGKTAFMLMGAGVKAGTYGNVNLAGQAIMADPASGADAGAGQLESYYMFNTLLKFFGVDPADAGVATSGRSKIVTAVLA